MTYLQYSIINPFPNPVSRMAAEVVVVMFTQQDLTGSRQKKGQPNSGSETSEAIKKAERQP